MGTTDYLGVVQDRLGIVDFKTQNVKVTTKNSPPTYYESWPWQLAGYALAITDYYHRMGAHLYPDAHVALPERFVSVVINTNPEHPKWAQGSVGVWSRVWKYADIKRGAEIIKQLASLWYTVNKVPAPGTPERAEREERLLAEPEKAGE